MDYSYLHGRQENRSTPETSHEHHQNQYPTHCQHQQYPSAPQVIQAGYPSLRFGPYIHPLQGQGSMPGQVPGQEGLLSRIPSTDSLAVNNRGPIPRIHEFENVLTTAAQVGSPPLHFGSDVASSQLVSSIHRGPTTSPPLPPHPIQEPRSTIEASYHSDNVPNTRTSLPSKNPSNPASVSGPTGSAAGSAKKRKKPLDDIQQEKTRIQEHMTQIREPPVPIQRPKEPTPLVVFTKSCQTEPLFEKVAESAVAAAASSDLPEGLSFMEKIDQERRSLGVMATRALTAGEEFGPFTGDFVKDGIGLYNPYTWEVCVKGKTWFYIDGATDPDNWMIHVQLAKCQEEQNLEAYQFYGNIFFRTTKEIESGTELKVFYSRDYRKHAGFKTGFDGLQLDRDSERFVCKDCNCRYTNAKSLMRHLKFEHDKENIPEQAKCQREAQLDSEVKAMKSHNINEIRKSSLEKMEKEYKGANWKTREQETTRRNKAINAAKMRRGITKPKKSDKETAKKHKEREVVRCFTCNKCRKQFPSEGHLKEHTAFHLETKDLGPVCETCGLECKNGKALKQHIISHDPNAFHCHLCNKNIRRKSCMVFHLRHEHQISVGERWGRHNLDELMNKGIASGPQEKDGSNEASDFVCSICGLQFEDKVALVEHALSHNPSPHQCPYCNTKFDRRGRLVTHLREAHKIVGWKKVISGNIEEKKCRLVSPDDLEEESEPFHPELPKDMLGKRILWDNKNPKIFKCKYCPQRFVRYDRVVRHEKISHTNSGRYMCEYCSAMFMYETAYILHKRKHTQDRPFKCGDCPRSFGSESALGKHLAEHRGERPFKCDVCGKGYTTRKNMTSHRLKQHKMPSTLAQCKFCPRSFKTRGALNKHENCHRGIRPHVCFSCGKAFRTKVSLQCHTRIHTGEKPYECRECQKCFRVAHQLTNHMVTHDKARRLREAGMQQDETPSDAATTEQEAQ